MAGILLHTKLHEPPLRPDRVARPRLHQKLDQGLRQGRKVTLVCAPAGFGKTTLVAEWLGSIEGLKAAWLLLDEGDNDLFLFLQYLFAALNKIAPGMDGSARQKLEAGSLAEDVLALLLNDLSGLALAPSVLVLDDYHCIHNPAIHEAMAFIIENKPPILHMMITTRQDPLLPLSRWRARAQVNEIRLSDLRFSQDEAADFLNHNLGLDLPTEDVAVLEARTEGWIAGLQLAAITIQQEKLDGSLSGFIQAFAGDNRYVIDYLMDEVLSRQSNDVQSFLLKTSILERMCAPLCASLCAPVSASLPTTSADSVLAYLDRANLFLIPLDHQREWYRYHHLFAQLLRQRLVSEQGEAAAASLHYQAARWFAAQGLIDEAVKHAAEAKEFGWLADLLETTLRKPATWSRGEISRLIGWLNKLPENMIDARPFLSMQVARILHIAGDTPAGIAWLQKSERSLAGLQDSAEKDHLLGIAAANWATFHVMLGADHQALGAAEKALRLLPQADALWRVRAMHAMALANDELGDLRQARQNYEQVIDLARQTDNTFLVLSTMGILSYLLNRMGKLHQAEMCCQQALASGKVNGQLTHAASLAWMALGMIQYEQNLLEDAEKTLLDAGVLTETSGIGLSIHNSDIHSVVCWIRLAGGNRPGALQMLQRIDETRVVTGRTWLRKRLQLEATRAQLALDFGDLVYASAWARGYEQSGPTDFHRANMDIILARVYRAEGQSEKAITLLERLLPDASRNDRNRNVIEILILLSLIYSRGNRLESAQSCLVRAVEMAAPEGYIRLFTAEGEPMLELIQEIRKSNLASLNIEFFNHLLASFQTYPIEGARTSANADLIEPLTDRELEVLRYLAEGLTMSEIAKRLYLSPNTLKAHSNTIYTKLDVHSRLQAVNKARDLNLIS